MRLFNYLPEICTHLLSSCKCYDVGHCDQMFLLVSKYLSLWSWPSLELAIIGGISNNVLNHTLSYKVNILITDHASMIELHTKKVVGYCVMSKTNRKCNVATKSGNTVRYWLLKTLGGSSKAVEPAMAVNILNEIKEKGYGVRKIKMDDETSTIAKIHSSIEKCSDIL